MRHALSVKIITLLPLLLVVPPALAAVHAFGVRDLVAMERISEPAPAPDGRLVAFTVSSLDLEGNRRGTDLWLVGADGTAARPLTRNPAGRRNVAVP